MNQHDIVEESQEDLTVPPLIYKIKQYKAKGILSQFSYMLIRPPRFLYNEQLLKPPQYYQKRYKVQQYEIPFKLTLYKARKMIYVILYLHGNSSSRFQGYMHLKQLPEGVGLACFDFNACGMRFDSQFITLGSKQSKQVDIAAVFLKNMGYRVVGWGRSMGSVSLLLSQQCDILVADSPFSSLQLLCKQSSQNFTPKICCCCFHCLYPCLFSCVRSDVQQKAGFDLRELEVADVIAKNPRNKDRKLFIMAGTLDKMIHYTHSQKIYDAFPGKKQIQIFEGSHNSHRPIQVYDKCFNFIQKQLGLKPQDYNQRLTEQQLSQHKRRYKIKLKQIVHLQDKKSVEIQLQQINVSADNQKNKMQTSQQKIISSSTIQRISGQQAKIGEVNKQHKLNLGPSVSQMTQKSNTFDAKITITNQKPAQKQKQQLPQNSDTNIKLDK